jgi:hypothetical protein
MAVSVLLSDKVLEFWNPDDESLLYPSKKIALRRLSIFKMIWNIYNEIKLQRINEAHLYPTERTNVTPSGRNPFGEVEERVLHLEGVLKAGDLTPMEELPDHFKIQDINTRDQVGRLYADPADFSSRVILCLPVRYSRETKKTIGLGLAPTRQNPGDFYCGSIHC